MDPITSLYRRSRSFRVLCYLLVVVATVLIWMVGDDQFAHYAQLGDMAILCGFIVFAGWAWWYGEERDRRRARSAAPTEEADTELVTASR